MLEYVKNLPQNTVITGKMKSERGITLASLVIYVIAMVITVTIITVITSYFYTNVDVTVDSYDFLGEFTKIQSNFITEMNLEGNRIREISANQNADFGQVYIVFSSGNQYTYVKANRAIYKNNFKIASYIDNCTFSEEIQNGKQVVIATVTINETTRTMKFSSNIW